MADQEYRDYYSRWWDYDSYKDWIHHSVDGASVYFMEEFGIKLKVVEISADVWDSDDAIPKDQLSVLLSAAIDDFYWDSNKRNADALIALTGKYLDYEGMAFRDSPAKP